MNDINWKIVGIAIVCLTVLESLALFKGMNGTVFSLVIAAISGLAGWTLKTLKGG